MWSVTVPLVVECRVASEQCVWGGMEWGPRGQLESIYKQCPRWHGNRRGGESRIARESVRSIFLSLDHAEFYSFCSEIQGFLLAASRWVLA